MTDIAAERAAGRRHLVGGRLRARRRALALTQQQVVDRLAPLGLQTSNRALSNYERGAGLDVAKLPALAAALDCSVTYLLGLTDDPRRWQPDAGQTAAAGQPRAPRARGAEDAAAGLAHPPILGPDVPDRTGTALTGA